MDHLDEPGDIVASHGTIHAPAAPPDELRAGDRVVAIAIPERRAGPCGTVAGVVPCDCPVGDQAHRPDCVGAVVVEWDRAGYGVSDLTAVRLFERRRRCAACGLITEAVLIRDQWVEDGFPSTDALCAQCYHKAEVARAALQAGGEPVHLGVTCFDGLVTRPVL